MALQVTHARESLHHIPSTITQNRLQSNGSASWQHWHRCHMYHENAQWHMSCVIQQEPKQLATHTTANFKLHHKLATWWLPQCGVATHADFCRQAQLASITWLVYYVAVPMPFPNNSGKRTLAEYHTLTSMVSPHAISCMLTVNPA